MFTVAPASPIATGVPLIELMAAIAAGRVRPAYRASVDDHGAVVVVDRAAAAGCGMIVGDAHGCPGIANLNGAAAKRIDAATGGYGRVAIQRDRASVYDHGAGGVVDCTAIESEMIPVMLTVAPASPIWTGTLPPVLIAPPLFRAVFRPA